MREILYRYKKEEFRFEAWIADRDDPWDTPLLVGTYSEKDILNSPLPSVVSVKRWEDAVHSGTGFKRG